MVQANHKYGCITTVKVAKSDGIRQRWHCVCDCGKKLIVRSERIRCGAYKTCNCKSRHASIQHGTLGGTNRYYTKDGAAKHDLYRHHLNNARRFGHASQLSESEFNSIISQHCHYCGCPPAQIHKNKRRGISCVYNTIDRVDSTVTYTKDNCVAACWLHNRMKHTMSYADFLKSVKSICTHLNLI